MKLQYLSEFVMLAHTLNFSIAAKRLHISQPVLSTHIKTMETELGFELFVRNRRSVALSEIGKEILPEMVEVVERYHDALDTAQKFLDAQSSKLTIGYLYNAFRDLLPSLSREFSNEHPGIDFRMHSFGYQGITNAMYQDAIDVAFTIDVDESLNDLCHIVKLKEDPICCVVRSDDSANLAFFYDELFQKSGFTPHISMQYREIDTRYLAIESGEGVALVGRHFQQFMGDDVVFIPFAESFWKYDLCAMWKKSNPNKSIPALMELVTEAFGLEA